MHNYEKTVYFALTYSTAKTEAEGRDNGGRQKQRQSRIKRRRDTEQRLRPMELQFNVMQNLK